MKYSVYVAGVVIAVSMFLVTACQEDDVQYGRRPPPGADVRDTDGSGETNDLEPGRDDQVPGDEYVSVLPDLTGRSYRVTVLRGVEPTDIVNPTWEEDIANYDLALLFHVVQHDTSTGYATIQITSCATELQKDDKGQRVLDPDGNPIPLSFRFSLEPAEFTTRLEGTRFRISSPITLSVVTSTVSKPFQVFGVTGRGEFNEDGTRVRDTWLEGAILEEETLDLCLYIPGMGSVNFHWFMNLAQICPTEDTTGDEKPDSYFFKGFLGARQVADGLFQPGIQPIESLIDHCEPHTDPCIR